MRNIINLIEHLGVEQSWGNIDPQFFQHRDKIKTPVNTASGQVELTICPELSLT